jgi:flavin reductase
MNMTDMHFARPANEAHNDPIPLSAEGSPQGFDSTQFRRAMGRFATGVAVVSVEIEGRIHGMTVNSFSSVSLDPPLCLICIDLRTRMHAFLEKSGAYGISILRTDQHAVSTHFASRNAIDMALIKFQSLGDVPVLSDCIARMSARIAAVHRCGDHSIFIGRLVALEESEGEPLAYYRGTYASLIANR